MIYDKFVLTEKDYEEVLQFCKDQFFHTDKFQVYYKATLEESVRSYANEIRSACSNGLSIGVRHEGKLVGIVTVLTYEQHQKIKILENQPEAQTLYQNLFSMYEPQKPEQTVWVFIGCIHAEYQRRGGGGQFLLETEKHCRSKGYKQFIMDLNHTVNLKSLQRTGYKIVGEKKFKEFEYNGNYPFLNFKDSEGVYLLSKTYEEQANQISK